jgi:hypothetical protein
MNVQPGTIQPELVDGPEGLLLAGAVDARPFVWRRRLNGADALNGPSRDVALGRSFKLLALAEGFYDSFEWGEDA